MTASELSSDEQARCLKAGKDDETGKEKALDLDLISLFLLLSISNGRTVRAIRECLLTATRVGALGSV